MQKPTLAELSAALGQRRVTSRELAEQCLQRIEDPKGEGKRAFLRVDRARVLAQADAMDALRASGGAPSPYAGIPISIKDLFDVTGEVTGAGSQVLVSRPPAATDAPCVARLRQAGFLFIGRTNMTEFAFSGLGLNPHFGTPLSPWHRAEGYIAGGSSSGAAVSVADGMAHAALGTDTGGSCRIPAAFTGLVGFKPTARRVPREGAVPLSTSLDSVGPLARSVACCATLDAILAGESSVDPAAVSSPASLRFAAPRTFVLDGIDRQVARDFEAALSRLAAAGAHIIELDVPEFGDIPGINSKGSLANAESHVWHRPLLAASSAQYDPRVLSRIQVGAGMTAADYIALLQARARFISAVSERFSGFDAILLPTTPITPPRLADLQPDDAYYRLNSLVLRNPTVINFLDGCAISLPMHEPEQAPTGLMVAGLHGADRRLFRVAAAVELLLPRSGNHAHGD
jgi:aspartyl-tRNA(Asn)/glutamyl-tRNA(Gln) amidotransferase subunit A